MLPKYPLPTIQPCNCAATETSCGAAEIAPAVCPICHGRRTERGRADIRRDVNISEWPQTEHRIEARNTTRAEPSPSRPTGKIIHLPYCPRHRPLSDG